MCTVAFELPYFANAFSVLDSDVRGKKLNLVQRALLTLHRRTKLVKCMANLTCGCFRENFLVLFSAKSKLYTRFMRRQSTKDKASINWRVRNLGVGGGGPFTARAGKFYLVRIKRDTF